MEFRPAEMEDLPQLQAVYRKIIAHMNENGLPIWDDIFPSAFFQGDIEQERLYLLTAENGEIAAAFALLGSSDGEDAVKWESAKEKALYLSRFGVSADYQRRGIGSRMLAHAVKTAGQKGAKYLRLFVVDINTPAAELYTKSGFRRAEGVYEEKIDDDITLREYGFEINVC